MLIRVSLMVLLLSSCFASAQSIDPSHPLFVFAGPERDGDAPLPSRSELIDAWTGVPDAFKLNSAMAVSMYLSERSHAASASDLLRALGDARVPALAHLDMANPRQYWDPDLVDEALTDTGALGVVVSGLQFNHYPAHGGAERIVSEPEARWLVEIIEQCAAGDMRCIVVLGELGWLRIMSMSHLEHVYRAIAEHGDTVIPIVHLADVHAPGNFAAAMGLWAEEGAEHWGITCGMRAVAEHAYVRGLAMDGDGAAYDANLPAAMAYGALNGAEVYFFDEADALWYRDADSWQQYARPSLESLVGRRVITARGDWVAAVRLVYRVGEVADADAFQLVVRDLDPMLGEGHMIRALHRADTMDRYPDYIPNRGNWIPLPVVSRHGEDAIHVAAVAPGMMAGVTDWSALLDRHYGSGGPADSALMASVNGVRFMMNGDEAGGRVQVARSSGPASVRRITAARGDGGIRLTWSGQLEDLSYTLWRRALPDEPFHVVAPGLLDRAYVDDVPEGAVAYAVTSVTGAKEDAAYSLGPGEGRIMEPGESVAAIEVVLREGMAEGEVRRRAPHGLIAATPDSGGPSAAGAHAALTKLSDAIARNDLDAAMSVFSEDYRDPQGWGISYVRRVIQLLLEQSRQARFDYEVRRTSVSETAANVYSYVRFSGAIDPNGADGLMYMPSTAEGTAWITFEAFDGEWRIIGSNPAMVNMGDLIRPLTHRVHSAGMSEPDRYEPVP